MSVRTNRPAATSNSSEIAICATTSACVRLGRGTLSRSRARGSLTDRSLSIGINAGRVDLNRRSQAKQHAAQQRQRQRDDRARASSVRRGA